MSEWNQTQALAELNQNTSELQELLAEWYAAAHRKLPWRVEPSLYRTVVSELMCQQTQIATVLPYFDRWMQQLPSFEALAGADEAVVLKLWEGLGYYSRARNLHKMAKEIVSMERVPEVAKNWQKLTGIGPYTSAAIASIHFNEPIAVVDGNVIRVLTRLIGDGREFRDGPSAAKALQAAADMLVHPERPGDHNQAMMELGALVCVKQRPTCTICPWVQKCVAAKTGQPEAFPNLKKRKIEKVRCPRAWAVKDAAILLQQIPSDATRLAGHWELPKLGELDGARQGELLAKKMRGISNQRIEEPIYVVEIGDVPEHCRWILWDDLPDYQLTGPHRRWINELKLTG
ncbi:MAG: A/G-specific adenine glycosylase [Opitutales bacterium]|nr:A/G-specific adenine glycosylase [Opitutales bacterium]NRA28566.1 A/G-specific adenine glycosylase [Opitutales bacterium]